MKSKRRSFGQRTTAIIAPFIAAGILAISIGMFSSCIKAQDSETTDKKYEDFDRKNFDNPTNIDNEWMTLIPGMRYVYAGTTVDEDKPIPHRVVIHVTDLTKMMRNTLWASCLGILFSMLLMMYEVGRLLFVFLRAPQGGVPVIQTETSAPSGWVSAIDMVGLMADLSVLAAELIVLAFTLWLLFRVTVSAAAYDRNPDTAAE